MRFEIKIADLKSVNSAFKLLNKSKHFECRPILLLPNIDTGYIYFLKGTEHSIHRLSAKITVIDRIGYNQSQLTGFGVDPVFLKQTCDKLGSSKKKVCHVTLDFHEQSIVIQKENHIFKDKLMQDNFFTSKSVNISKISDKLSPEPNTNPVKVNLNELIIVLSKCKQYRKELYSVKHKRTEVDRYDGVILIYKASDTLNAPSLTCYNVHEKHEIIYGTDTLNWCESDNEKDWIITLDPYLMVEKILDTLKGYLAINKSAEFIYLFPKKPTDKYYIDKAYPSFDSLVINSSADINKLDLIDSKVVDMQPTLNLVVMGYVLSNSTLNLAYPLS